ncbi:MAG: general secretion pathway protein GspB [Wenzhouxiangellaceae bacterium]|nr:general secretion pathway protein GspB [Wenzhouxiangellaceae bacterium]
MSLLLDALRKSEDQRRRGQPPSLDLPPVPGAAMPRSGRRLRAALTVAGIALVLVAAVMAIRSLQGPSAVPESGTSGVGPVLALPEAPADPTVAAVEDEARSGAGAESTAPGDEAAPKAARSGAVSSASSSWAREEGAPEGIERRTETAGEQDRAVTSDAVAVDPERGRDPAAEPDRASPTDRTSSTAAPGPEPAAGSGASIDIEDDERARALRAALERARARASSGPGAGEAGAREGEAAPGAVGTEPMANFVRPWELPARQRAEFPDLDMTVHVFATDPADRFVLINGQRYQEGAQLGDGARLGEITREGAIVEFGDYRVLVR